MLKKIVLIVSVLLLVLAQMYLIYALQHGGVYAFTDLWKSFGVTQTDYSKFVFITIKWWWSLPAFCLLLLTLALFRPSLLRSSSAVVVSLVGVIALYWSVYAPALFINV